MSDPKISEFQFSQPFLIDMSFHINEDYARADDTSAVNLPTSLNVQRPSVKECVDNTAVVILEVHVGEKSALSPYEVAVKMGANYRWGSSFSADMVDKLLSQNAPSLLLSYIRPLITQITEASSLGAIHLPFFNFVSDR